MPKQAKPKQKEVKAAARPSKSNSGHVIVKKQIHELTRAAYNPRKITSEALEGLRSSIDRFGLVQPIVWNKRTGNVVGGHQRLSALEMRGDSEVEVIEVDLSEQEEKALNVTLNNQSIQGTWEPVSLESLLGEIKEFPEIDFGELRISELESLLISFDESLDSGFISESKEDVDTLKIILKFKNVESKRKWTRIVEYYTSDVQGMTYIDKFEMLIVRLFDGLHNKQTQDNPWPK